MYRIGVKQRFAAAHVLVGHAGKCSRVHGHTWTVEAVFAGEEIAGDGLLLDFEEAGKVLSEVVGPFDHALLNEVEPFQTISPTAENVARVVYTRLAERVGAAGWPVVLESVTVWESDDARATYCEG